MMCWYTTPTAGRVQCRCRQMCSWSKKGLQEIREVIQKQKWLLFTEVNFKGESVNYKLSPALKNVVLMNQAMWHKSLAWQVNAAPQCSHSSDKYKLLRYSPVIKWPPGSTTYPPPDQWLLIDNSEFCCGSESFDGSPGAHWLPSQALKTLDWLSPNISCCRTIRKQFKGFYFT